MLGIKVSPWLRRAELLMSRNGCMADCIYRYSTLFVKRTLHVVVNYHYNTLFERSILNLSLGRSLDEYV